uniref:Uncharacterized protein n=1 Tax=Ananas comosus var. bracteatus TaxID=296719 RepID=A0A6V7QF40_ANACO|nr:unnamed protein product [Ananas comosus var. bracteatus]
MLVFYCSLAIGLKAVFAKRPLTYSLNETSTNNSISSIYKGLERGTTNTSSATFLIASSTMAILRRSVFGQTLSLDGGSYWVRSSDSLGPLSEASGGWRRWNICAHAHLDHWLRPKNIDGHLQMYDHGRRRIDSLLQSETAASDTGPANH